jgi:hypothetical protein
MQVCPTAPKSRDSFQSIAATSDRKANAAPGFTVAAIEPPPHQSLRDFVRGATQPSDHQVPMLTRLHGIRYLDSQQVNDREALPPQRAARWERTSMPSTISGRCHVQHFAALSRNDLDRVLPFTAMQRSNSARRCKAARRGPRPAMTFSLMPPAVFRKATAASRGYRF